MMRKKRKEPWDLGNRQSFCSAAAVTRSSATSGVDFTIILQAAFAPADPKSVKMPYGLTVFLRP